MIKAKKRSACPISSSLDIWGDKWSLLIIRDLMLKLECTYGDFLKAEEKISTNILAVRLQSLEENGVIEKLQHPESKAKVLYRLTQKGVDLAPLMLEINLWAEKYLGVSKEVKTILKEARKDKEGYLRLMMKQLTKGAVR